MPTRKIHDLCVVTRKYPDPSSPGRMKNVYLNIGGVFEKENGGRFLIIEPTFNPAGVPHEPGKGIMVSMFDTDESRGQQRQPPGQSSHQGQGQSRPQNQSQGGDDEGFADDIPF